MKKKYATRTDSLGHEGESNTNVVVKRFMKDIPLGTGDTLIYISNLDLKLNMAGHKGELDGLLVLQSGNNFKVVTVFESKSNFNCRTLRCRIIGAYSGISQRSPKKRD